MKKTLTLITIIVAVSCLPYLSSGQPPSKETEQPRKIDVLKMTSVPDGNYLAEIESHGSTRLINVEVKDNKAKCVNSDDQRLIGVTGEFKLFGNGVFSIFLQNDYHRGSQFWFFREDGTALIKEIPDRGEKQKAVPVKGKSLLPPDKV